MVKKAAEIWRDYSTDLVPASGKHKPIKADIRALLSFLERGISFSTRAEVSAESIPSTVPRIFVRGHTTEGRGGAWYARLGSAPSPTKPWHFQSADGAWWQLDAIDGWTSPDHFGAARDATAIGVGTDDTAAIEACDDFCAAFNTEMKFLGMYRYKPTRAWNPLSPSGKARSWFGATPWSCGLFLDSTYELAFECASGAASFFWKFQRIWIEGARNGSLVRFGRNDLADYHNQFEIDINVGNRSSASSSVIGTKFNNCYKARGSVTSNCNGTGRPGQPSTPGVGTAIEINQVQFSELHLDGGNANIALAFRNGYSYSNVFFVDLEEVNTAVECSSANATKNVIVGGQILATTTLNATAGSQNIFGDACNITNYGGGSYGTNVTGWRRSNGNPLSHFASPTPAAPASGVFWKNTTGYAINYKFRDATISQVDVKAPDGGIVNYSGPAGSDLDTVYLPPDWEIKLTYSGGTPSIRVYPAG